MTEEVEDRILRVALHAFFEVEDRLCEAGVDYEDALYAAGKVYTRIAIAVEAAAAKAVGYETWAAFQAAEAAGATAAPA